MSNHVKSDKISIERISLWPNAMTADQRLSAAWASHLAAMFHVALAVQTTDTHDSVETVLRDAFSRDGYCKNIHYLNFHL